MKSLLVRTACFLLGLSLAATAGASAPPQPEYVPYCTTPQITAPMQGAGATAGVLVRSDAAWNGKDYAVVWADSVEQRLHFRRFFADGTPAGAITTPSGLFAEYNHPPSLVWNGGGYGVAWTGHSGSSYQTYFARLDANGALVGSEVKASFVGLSETANTELPSLAWSGAGYAVAWNDGRNGTNDIFATLLNADGTIANSGASHDLVLCNAASFQTTPSVAWSKGGGRYRVVWQDFRNTVNYEIWGAVLLPNGTIGADGSALVWGTSSSFNPALCDMGSGLGMAWYDFRDGAAEIYFARLSAGGAKIGSDVRLTYAGVGSYNPRILWTGAEYGVFWADDRSGNSDLWFQRVSAAGTVAGANTQVTVTSEMYFSGAAFGRYGYLVTGRGGISANYVQAWGCAADSTPPTCPMNLVAYNVTGTTATVAWIPSVEDVTDLAYYEVYRNSNLVAMTSDTLYADTGLALNTTYNYYVRPVNAMQTVNGSCTSSIYVKSNATLLLKLDKSTPDAHLSWTDASMNNYNVFRGTNPQVMSQIGSTAGMDFSDPNVLMDSVLYFYTVDEPGW